MDTQVMPPDFMPGLLTRLRVWRDHSRLHRILRGDLLRNGGIGQSIDCAHCDLRWIVRRTAYATYLQEARR